MDYKSGNLGVPSWFLTTLGVIALLGITAITIVRLVPGDNGNASLPPPQPAFSLPGTTSGPQDPVSLVPPSAPAASPDPAERGSHSWQTTVAAPRPRTTPPPAALVTGRYSVLQSFGDAFIGQVLLTNTTGTPQNWRATLVFPSNVGDLRTSWLESLPQPTLSRHGHSFTWTSSVPLAARSTGELRFHFERTGSGDTPDSCEVNGAPC